MSFSKIQTPPKGCVLLLTGSPGAGKSTFCHQVVVKSIADQCPVILVATENTPEDVFTQLRARGLGDKKPDQLRFVDAFTQTVGLTCNSHQDTVCAHCADLNSLSMAITKLSTRMGQSLLLVLDSLTSPYLFNGMEVVKFMQLFLTKFAQNGNAVLATMDEGCGKAGDLGAMKSVAEGIVRLEMQTGEQSIQIVKHPQIAPTMLQISIARKFTTQKVLEEIPNPDVLKKFSISLFTGKAQFRPRMSDFVNAFWPKLAYWSGMLWDPQGFPEAIYPYNLEDQSATGSDELNAILPLPYKIMFRMINGLRRIGVYPNNFSRVQDVERIWRFPMLKIPYGAGAKYERCGIIKYLPDKSKRNEHHYRLFENADCWDFDGVGTTLANYLPPSMAGQLIGMEKENREWNAIETRCIGLGDPYCEVKLVPGPLDELNAALKKDAETVARIHARLITLFADHILQGKILTDRPQSGSGVHLHIAFHTFGFPHIAGHRAQMALRMGGVKTGKEIAEHLMATGLDPDEAVQQILKSFESLKAGIASTMGDKIKVEENIEPLRTQYMTRLRELSCYFTTGFLNGVYGAAHGLRVKETRCTAAGDSCCEWEIV